MTDKANISDVDVLERFRTQLMLFLEKSSSSLNEVTEEVKRTRIWLQSEQNVTLQRQMRMLRKKLEQCEAELYTARMADADQRKTGIQMEMRRIKENMRDLEKSQRAVKAWSQHFDSKVEVEARKVDRLRSMIDSDMRQAVQYLNESAKALHDYSGTGSPPKSNPPNES